MLKWDVTPLKQVNDVRFGMSRSDVRNVLGGAYTEFKKTKYSKTTTDDFGSCHVYYDTDDQCIAVELFQPCEVSLDGVVIFPADLAVAKKVIPDLEAEGDCYISKTRSIGIFAPAATPESILIGAADYYM